MEGDVKVFWAEDHLERNQETQKAFEYLKLGTTAEIRLVWRSHYNSRTEDSV